MRTSALTVSVLLVVLLSVPANADDAPTVEQERFFETRIRPLLVEHCLDCHGPDTQEADVRFDVRSGALGDGGSEAVVVPGRPEESRLMQVLRYDGDVQMPPDGKLDDELIETFSQWIAGGAPWPRSEAADAAAGDPFLRLPDGSIDFARAAAEHWAYRPIEQSRPPDVEQAGVCRTPLDRFIQARLEGTGLTMSAEADRRTLIRRATIDLLGIPPTYEEVEAFAADESPDAYPRLIDRLLASPQYGERWARHWLDVARYADTKGYVFTENRFYPNSYTYRDYVIAAFNSDKPYDRFLMEQLAADQLGLSENDPALAALGFLTVGPRFRNNEHDIIDDRIDVTFRGLMGMTLACARCHDHKYDPIPTADYYSLYGVFAGSYEPEQLPVVGEIDETPEYIAYRTELETRRQAVEDYMQQAYHDLLNQARTRAGDYLLAVLNAADQISGDVSYEHGTPRDKLTALWRGVIQRRANLDDPVFGPWRLFGRFPKETFAHNVNAWLDDPGAQTPNVNPLVVAAVREAAPQSIVDLARIYGQLFAGVHEHWQTTLADASGDPPASLPDAHEEQFRRVLYGAGSVTDVPFEEAEQRVFERDNRDRIRALRREVSEWEVNSEGAPPRAMVMLDREQPVEPVIFERGSPGRRGERVPRRFPQVLSDVAPEPFEEGSGRRELAEAIASPENPLTARVIVNRVWMHHFGEGLVATLSDFGSRSSPPTHPELLDYLAATFIERGWSIKDLHRRIMLSAVYRQSSADRPECRAADPENRLLWRMNRRRLEFEAMRDSMLFVTERLDTALGSRPVEIEREPFSTRRTVYALIDRNNFSALLRTFDLPTPDSSAPQRPHTTVPQQALFALNAPFTQETAAAAAELVRRDAGSIEEQVTAAFRRILARDPTPEEQALVAAYLHENPDSLSEVLQSLLMTNEFLFVD